MLRLETEMSHGTEQHLLSIHGGVCSQFVNEVELYNEHFGCVDSIICSKLGGLLTIYVIV